ncbi:sensor histidine kinase [Micromonospora sp. NPDC050417]|uniref:sensor histidine kinase n=1 Tax=Micromonospora sp. NPDC050417 TaxID=3364280 RepID=UPI00379D81BF
MISRLTIRGRLTLWYAAVFAVTGAVLLTLMYLLVRREFFAASGEVVERLGEDAAKPSVMTGQHLSDLGLGGVPQPNAQPGLGVVEVVTSEARTDALRTIMIESGITFVVLAAVSLALCWLIAGRALRPLRRITATAAGLSQETLDARIGLRGARDEIHTLADAFDQMLDRLGRAFQAQRLFVANASHELRTPLAIIRTACEVALSRPERSGEEYRRALRTAAAAAARSDATLTSLLRLAQTARSAALEPVDLAALVRSEIAAWPTLALPVHANLAVAPCVADPAQVGILLRNLLENAARYNTDGGAVWVTTGNNTDSSWLRVENTGPAVDPSAVPSLRQPFQRGTGRSTGSPGAGLGLAIVDAVVTAHGGDWSVTPRDGGGLSVTINLAAG